MALISTVGAADANSYVTVAEAEAYFGDRIHAEGWVGLSVNDKPKALVTASLQLDWYARWKGSKATTTQSMGFPRIGLLLPDGTEYDSTVVPPEVKKAVFELALSSVDTDRTSDSDMAGLSEIKAGSVQLKADDGLYNTKPKVIPNKIWKIINDFTIRASSGLVRLIRA